MDGALRHYSEAVRLRPDYAEAHCNRGNALLGLGKAREAVAEYRDCLRINPGYALAHTNLASALYVLGDYTEAWREVRLSERAGGNPDPNLVRQLAQKMPAPKK